MKLRDVGFPRYDREIEDDSKSSKYILKQRKNNIDGFNKATKKGNYNENK